MMSWDNMPVIRAWYDTELLSFGLDTGNTESMFSQEFIPLLRSKVNHRDILRGLDGDSEEEVIIADDIELLILGTAVHRSGIPVLKRDIFPTRKGKVQGLLGADILQNQSFIPDYQNRIFRFK